jgi:hypothetical protein
MLLSGGATPWIAITAGGLEGPVAVPTRESAPATRFFAEFAHYFLSEALLLARPDRGACTMRHRARFAPDQSKRPPDQLLHQTPSGRVAARDSVDKLSVEPWLLSFSR